MADAKLATLREVIKPKFNNVSAEKKRKVFEDPEGTERIKGNEKKKKILKN